MRKGSIVKDKKAKVSLIVIYVCNDLGQLDNLPKIVRDKWSLYIMQILQPFAEMMAVARIFIELGNPLKFLSSWPWSTVGMVQTRIGTQETM
jgi:hypothetical protein